MSSDTSGTSHFWQQRATAIANLPLVLFLLWFIVSHLGATRSDVVASLQHPLNAILLGLSFVSILWHMRLGMEMVLEDYIQTPGTLRAGLLLNRVFCGAMAVAAFYALYRMSFAS